MLMLRSCKQYIMAMQNGRSNWIATVERSQYQIGGATNNVPSNAIAGTSATTQLPPLRTTRKQRHTKLSNEDRQLFRGKQIPYVIAERMDDRDVHRPEPAYLQLLCLIIHDGILDQQRKIMIYEPIAQSNRIELTIPFQRINAVRSVLIGILLDRKTESRNPRSLLLICPSATGTRAIWLMGIPIVSTFIECMTPKAMKKPVLQPRMTAPLPHRIGPFFP